MLLRTDILQKTVVILGANIKVLGGRSMEEEQWFTLEALAHETQMMRYASNRKVESSTIANNGNRKSVLINGALRR